MKTLESTPEQKRLAQKLSEKRRAEIERRRKEEIDRVARILERDMRQRGMKTDDASPTPHRLKRGGLAKRPIHGPSGFVEATTYGPSLDIQSLSKSWSPSIAGAYELFVRTATKLGIRRVTMNYERIGATVSSGTFGIAIDQDEDYQAAAELYDFLVRRLRIFDASGDISVVEVLNFVLCRVESHALGKVPPQTWADVGRLIEPAYKDEASSKGTARGAFNILGRFMAGCFLEYYAMYGGEMKRRNRER